MAKRRGSKKSIGYTSRKKPNIEVSSSISRSRITSTTNNSKTQLSGTNKKIIEGISSPTKMRSISSIQTTIGNRVNNKPNIESSISNRTTNKPNREITQNKDRLFLSRKNIDGVEKKEIPKIDGISQTNIRSRPISKSINNNDMSIGSSNVGNITSDKPKFSLGLDRKTTNGPLRISDL